MTWFVYVITNTLNGKKYVGKSGNPRRRWLFHLHQMRNGCPWPLYRALRKYGPHAFDRVAVAEFNAEADAFAHERFLIATLGTADPARGYNITAGGEGASGKPMGAKAREALAKWNASPQAKLAIKKAIAASVAARSGKPLGKEHRDKLSAAFMGRVFTPEWRQKISDAKRAQSAQISAQSRISSAKLRRLSDADVVSVRRAAATGESQRAIAVRYGVSESLISRIMLGKARRDAH